MPFIGRDGRTAFLPTSVNTSSSLKISNEGDLIVDTDTLFVDSSANRVGIGTASPSRALHINAGPTDTAMLIESTDGDVQINFKDVDSTNGVSIGCDNEDFYVRSGLTTETLRITSDGKVRVPDGGDFTAGNSDDLRMTHVSSHSYIENYTGNLYIFNASNDSDVRLQTDDGSGGLTDYVLCDGSEGSVVLKHYGSTKLETTTTGIDVTGTVVADGFSAGDDERIKLGAGEDLLLYHDGANSWLINNTGDLSIRNLADDKDVMIQSDNGSGGFETYIQADGSSRAAKLFHSGGVKLETTSAGVTVTGALEVSAATNITVGGTALPSLTGLLGGSLRGTLGVATMHMTASDPSSPVQGQFYFNSLDQKAKIYTGSSFVDLVPAGSGGGGGGGSSSDANATFRKYTYAISSTTNSVSGAAQGETSAGSFVTGLKYTIKTPGNTDFTAIGAGNNTAGTAFVATGAGTSGETGVAYNTLIYSTGGDQNVEVYVNGVKAVEGATNDYIATNGSSVNFVANLASGDVIDIQVYELLTNDAFVLAAGGTFTGNVGINTTSISNRLHINSSGNDEGILLTQAGSHYNGLIADANRTAADNYILNLQANWDGNGVARIAFETGDDTTNKDDGRIKFSTSSSGSNPIVRMHITPSGNVGIGQAEATNATARLQVKGEGALSGTHHKYLYATDCGILVRGNEAAIDLIGSDAGNHAASILLRNATEGFGFVNDPGNNVHDGALTLKSFTSTADNFYIHGVGTLVTNLVNIVTFTKAGNVGIGDSSPADALTVYRSNVGNPAGITIRNTETSSTYSHARLRLESQNGAAYAHLWADVANTALRLGYNSSATVNIYDNGKLTSPNQITAGTSFGIANVSGSIAGSGGGQDYIGLRHGSTFGLMLKTFGTNVGSVGIGTTNPDEKLEVYNSATAGNTSIKVHNDKTGDAASLILEGKRTSFNDSGQLLFRNNGYSVAGVFALSGDGNNNDNGEISFRTSAAGSGNAITERLRIDSIGRIKIGPIANQASTTTHCPVYIDVHSDITAFNTAEGAAQTGLVRIEETGSNANRYHGIEFRNRQSGDIRIMNLDVNTSDRGDLVIALPDQEASAGLHYKVRFNSLKSSLQIAGKGGPSLSNSATEHVDVYIATKTQISAIDTNPGAEVAGVIRFEDKGSNNNRYHGLELRNKNSGDVRIFNHDQGITNAADLVFGVDNGSSLVEALRLKYNGRVQIPGQNVSVGTQDRRRHQIITGKKTFSSSNSYIDLFYSGHSHSITIQYSILQGEAWVYGGAHGKVDFFTAYGSTNGMQNHTHRRVAMNGGQISGDAEFQYLNSGGSTSHIIRVRVPYSSTSLGTFQIAYSVSGLSDNTMYAL